MRVRVSSLVAGVFVVALAVTGCAGSTGGQASGDPVTVVPTVKADAGGAASESATTPAEVSETPALEEPDATATYRIGDTGPGGGIVFYDAGSVQPWGRYLEAAPAGWSRGSPDPEARWCKRPGRVSTSTAVGTGAANTTAMLATCSPGAATTASGYRGGGKTDWFLPSKDELNALYEQRASVGEFYGDDYWSSSHLDEDGAWYQNFDRGRQRYNYKQIYYYVEPVRAF